jgi:signal transduction histidine kinase
VIVGDANRLEQVFLNFISNSKDALESCPQNKARQLCVRTCVSEDMVLIEFEDNGAGIKKDHLVRIFDPFFTTKPVGKGTGLGLSISTGIIREHHGSIEVHSVVGQGTKFSIRFPLAKPETLPETHAA